MGCLFFHREHTVQPIRPVEVGSHYHEVELFEGFGISHFDAEGVLAGALGEGGALALVCAVIGGDRDGFVRAVDDGFAV